MRPSFILPLFARTARRRAVAGAMLMATGVLAAGVWVSSAWMSPRLGVGRVRVAVCHGVVWTLTLPEVPSAPVVVTPPPPARPRPNGGEYEEFHPRPGLNPALQPLLGKDRVRKMEQGWARMVECNSSVEQREVANNIRFIGPGSMQEFPLWPAVVAPVGAGLLLLWWAARSRRLAAGVSCWHCGYSLVGLAGGAVCPECGKG